MPSQDEGSHGFRKLALESLSRICGLLTGFFLVLISAEVRADDASGKLEFFREKVVPILQERCFECHSHEAGKSKGGLVLDSKSGWTKGGKNGPSIVPGKPEDSLLFTAVLYQDEDFEMPPKAPLEADEVEVLRRWISDGAVDPRISAHGETSDRKPWSFSPVKDVPLPEVDDSDWPLNNVDHFILAKLEEAKLAPVTEASPRRLIRRLHLDLTGLPPTPEAMAHWLSRFEKDPASQSAVLALADELMATPQFGERRARHWLDTARYAESNGNNRNRVFRYAWRYRNWVIDALSDDKPYDQFLKEQLAGDLMPAPSSGARKRQRIATGFLAIGPKPYFPTIVPFDPEEPDRARYDWAAEQINATMSGMMGVTVGCARCHDHKTDPIPTRDYYALAGIFRSTEPRFGMWHHLFGVGEGQAQRDFLYDWNLLVLNDEVRDEIEPLQERYQPLVMEENSIILHQKHWPEQIKRQEAKIAKGGLSPEAVANLEKNIAQKRKTLEEEAKRLIEVQREKEALKKQFTFSVDSAMGVEDSAQPSDVHIRIGGEHAERGDLAGRGFLTSLDFEDAPSSIDRDQSGRLQLAEWIAHPKNPLTARVAVNRIWHQLFGGGLVGTLDNFGNSGEVPSHPALLDHLAHTFVHEFGWSQKKMIRYLISSRTYLLDSNEALGTEKHFERDPENTLFWRTQPRRLEAEAIRDSMLAVAGRLDRGRPGSSMLVDFEYHADIVHPDRLRVMAALEGNHRTIYVPTLRGHRNRLYDLFDYPDDEAVNSKRAITTVPTQALFLMNNPFIIDLADTLAKRLHSEADTDLEKLSLLYQLCFGRPPTDAEKSSDLAFLKNKPDAWSHLAQSCLISGEFLFRL